jgi:predicted Zn-dependent protease
MRAKEIAKFILDNTKGEAQVNVLDYSHYLIRFTRNTVHQSIQEKGFYASVKVVIDKRIGEASSNSVEENALKEMIQRAEIIASLSPPNPEFVSLPKPSPLRFSSIFVEPPSPIEASEMVKSAIEVAKKKGVELSGSLACRQGDVCVLNSLGIDSSAPTSEYAFRLVATKEDGSGFASIQTYDWRKINPGELAEEAVERALMTRNPREIEPGEYDVVLLPYAVDEIMLFFGWFGFNAQALQEGRSFLEGRMGEKIFDESITLIDDAENAQMPFPFDWEGVAKQKVVLVEKGIAKGVVYDSFTAHKEGRESTGHSMRGGPFPSDMILYPGEHSLEELIESLDKGILVTRLHYTNIVHPKLLVFTGMTRDGTFFVEKGKIKYPLRNLRFTQNLINAFSDEVLIGKEAKRGDQSLVPPIRLNKFNFTGISREVK